MVAMRLGGTSNGGLSCRFVSFTGSKKVCSHCCQTSWLVATLEYFQCLASFGPSLEGNAKRCLDFRHKYLAQLLQQTGIRECWNSKLFLGNKFERPSDELFWFKESKLL
ncbi:unnamed protein product [Cuscuta epithymum]|uniref:Uncharacterized protein n=1 Tax=Cuscuta epithymum TaxID=186058 RepID=A0AAV0DT48_9ASTE|nr:unnamed protein product [Cuscuta epithymum]CAH9143552.1 unnamed protein product [Cuscuta epithymum]